jgi:CheY-like chemotaxis protein/class 3 adenylate cyclase
MSDAGTRAASGAVVTEQDLVVLVRDRLTAEFLRRPLEPLGWRLHVATSEPELREMVQASRPRAVLLPRRVPGTDLGALVAWVRTPQADGRAAAAILLGTSDADRSAARELKADAFLTLPFSDSELLGVVGAATRKKKLILLADDSPMIHRHTVPILEEAGYAVVSAVDGDDALAKVKEHGPDLVITDIEMPRLDGYGVCKAIKQHAATSHVPVLICSSLGEAADLERGFDAGADDYLVKPVLPEELTTRVRHLFFGSMPASRERVLVVDDSPAQRHYVQDCLARQGFDVVTAENGRLGLEKARAVDPALIVSDYDMPVMTGFEMVHALKRDPETRDIPIIMLTARESRRDVAQMRAAGATAYLVKPFAQDKCIATVERTLAERRLYAYKEASREYISEGAARAAEERAAAGDLGAVRAEERNMSVMFSDICGFTMMSGKMAPRDVINLLNEYFDVMCPIVKQHGGDIDKFIGDAIMAVFDHLPEREPPAARAVRAALAMQAAMPAFNARAARPLEMRIGVNTGPLVRGDLGSRFVRRDFTVIGDTVNRANRFEGNAPPGGVLISESTYAELEGLVTVSEREGLKLKGVEAPVRAFVVHAIRPAPEEGNS